MKPSNPFALLITAGLLGYAAHVAAQSAVAPPPTPTAAGQAAPAPAAQSTGTAAKAEPPPPAPSEVLSPAAAAERK